MEKRPAFAQIPANLPFFSFWEAICPLFRPFLRCTLSMLHNPRGCFSLLRFPVFCRVYPAKSFPPSAAGALQHLPPPFEKHSMTGKKYFSIQYIIDWYDALFPYCPKNSLDFCRDYSIFFSFILFYLCLYLTFLILYL